MKRCTDCVSFNRTRRACDHPQSPTQAMVERPGTRIAPWCPISKPKACAECGVEIDAYNTFCTDDCESKYLGPVVDLPTPTDKHPF